MNDQNAFLANAADAPSIGSMASQETMDHAIATSMGRKSTSSGPGAVRGIASWEGYYKTAPAHLEPNKTGYRNPAYHARKQRVASMAGPSVPRPSANLSSMMNVSNHTTKSMIKGGTSATKLEKLTKLSRMF